MTLRAAIAYAAADLETERRALLAELDAVDARLNALEARLGAPAHDLIADVRFDTNELRARLLARAPETIH